MKNKTTFTKSDKGVWSWTTRSENNNITASSGGYNSGDSALNGFLSQQGHTSWVPGATLPEGYTPGEVQGDSFVIEQETQ